MDAERYRSFLKTQIPSAKDASGNTEIVCRCFSCPDSADPNSGHFYISIPQDEDTPSYFNCFKCNYSGMVTHQRLIEWGLFDVDMALDISNHNGKILSNPKTRAKLLAEREIYDLDISNITIDDLTNSKLRYINKRLGIDLTYDDIRSNKIILNLKDLLNSNNITKYTRHQSIIDQLDSSFLGFLSYDNAFINMRNLTSKGTVYSSIDKRYINYNIFDKKDNTCKFYISPINIDIMNPNPIKIHIGEGPFDTLSIKYNLRKDFEHNIYAAVGGNGYKGLIRYIITNLKLLNLELHLYVDIDVERWKILDLANFLSVFSYPLYLHRNTIGKDMGVSIDKINESIERII